MGVITIKTDFSAFSLPLLSLLVFSALILPALIFLYSLDHSCHALFHYYIRTSCSIQRCRLIPPPPLPRSAGCSLLSGVLRAPLQPVVSAVCAQHRAVPSCHGPLWVPVWLLWLSVQPRQVAFCVPLTFSLLFHLLSDSFTVKFYSLLLEVVSTVYIWKCPGILSWQEIQKSVFKWFRNNSGYKRWNHV